MLATNERWAPKVAYDFNIAKTALSSQKAPCFDFETLTYEVMEERGTTRGREHRGACKHKVVITQNTCTCSVLTLMHFSCSHMITTCHDRGVDVKVPVRFQ